MTNAMAAKYTPEQVAAAQRAVHVHEARSDFIRYCELMSPDEPPAQHHRLLGEDLQRIADGTLKRLMVFQPPGSAKSTYCSVLFPSYYFGQHPGDDMIQASNTADLAARFGRRVRNFLGSREYARVFKTGLDPQVTAAAQWMTDQGGEYFAVGVDGTITGRRANGGIIDDPVKGHQDADSESQRESVWQWYLSDFCTRLKPDGWQILIQTRWHEDDLAGRILPEGWMGESGTIECRDGKTWKVICLPAQAMDDDILGREEGEWLWPEYLGPTLKEAKSFQSPRTWNALYQQIPTPESGTYFQRHWFDESMYKQLPEGLKVYMTSDFATMESRGDYTEFGVWGLDEHDNIFAIDWWSGRKTADVWVDALLDLVEIHKPTRVFGESGVIKNMIEPFLSKRMRERSVYLTHEWITRIRDKETSVQAFRGKCSMGHIHFPENSNWAERVIAQLVAFPAGKYDDAVDVCSLLGLALDQLQKPSKPHSFRRYRRRVSAWTR